MALTRFDIQLDDAPFTVPEGSLTVEFNYEVENNQRGRPECFIHDYLVWITAPNSRDSWEGSSRPFAGARWPQRDKVYIPVTMTEEALDDYASRILDEERASA